MSTSKSATLSMDAYRNAAFRQAVIERLREARELGVDSAQVAADIAAEQQALAAAITMPEFVTTAGKLLVDAQKRAVGDMRYVSPSVQAEESMRQIVRRRAAEAISFAHTVLQQSYYEPLLGELSLASKDVSPSLYEVKYHETLEELLHKDAHGAPQVIAHIDASAKGTMLEHDALATVFSPTGELFSALMRMLTKQLPDATPKRINRLASQWLEARHAAATLSADLASPNGAAYIEAVRQSTQWHRQAPSPDSPGTIAKRESKGGSKARALALRRERAEDVAYTLNHAISCGTTDVVIAPTISALLGVNVGCDAPAHRGHDHHHDHGHHHDHSHGHEAGPHHPSSAGRKLNWRSYGHEVGHYLKGEIIGDVGAVPLTIFVQRCFPGFMDAVRRLVEPLAAPFFRRGARHAANRWADKGGVERSDPSVQVRSQEIYENEIKRLPQAVVWNLFAFPIGVIGQKLGGHQSSYARIIRNKTYGALISNGMLLGGRAVAPDLAEKWDKANSDHVIGPVTKAVDRWLGGDGAALSGLSQQHPQVSQWRERVAQKNMKEPAL